MVDSDSTRSVANDGGDEPMKVRGRVYWTEGGLLLVFIAIAASVLAGLTQEFDKHILLFIRGYASGTADSIALAVTSLGNVATIVSICVVLAFFLYVHKNRLAAVQIITSLSLAIATNALLKLLFQRDRPDLWEYITHVSTFSFPSGHALLSAMLATAVLLLGWNTKYRLLLAVFAPLFAITIGLSRLYLGVHYPTDVMAGWCIGIIVGMTGVIVGRKLYYRLVHDRK